jgi:hypothetical protein
VTNSDALLARQHAGVLRPEDFDPNLKPAFVAAILGISEKTLRKWRCTGEVALRYEKLGKLIFYRASAVQAFRAANTITPAVMAEKEVK